MKKVLATLLILVVLAGAAGYFGYTEWLRRVDAYGDVPFGAGTAVVDIPNGTSPTKVARLLSQAGVTSDEHKTVQFIRRSGLGPQLKSGEYEFTGPLTPRQAFEKIARGEVKQYQFTIPEGLRVDEIADIISNSTLGLQSQDVAAALKDNALLLATKIPARSPEGFLFPDTYRFTRGTSAKTVVSTLYKRAVDELKSSMQQASTSMTPLEVMTLASIIEKETGQPEERPRIGCVFHNRLKLGMKLQTDPTVLYARMLREGTFTKNIRRSDLLEPHPYNTYVIRGLPPGPIASPGKAAIEAALHPSSCEDLFFVARNDGTHVFCPTLECHESNVKKWQVEFFKKK